jgi:hypothetical protein
MQFAATQGQLGAYSFNEAIMPVGVVDCIEHQREASAQRPAEVNKWY